MAERETTVIRFPEGVTVGQRVRLARSTVGLSRKEVARALGVSLKTYQRIEEGARELRLGELNTLAALTGQEVAFFGASSEVEGDGAGVLPPALPVVNEDNGA